VRVPFAITSSRNFSEIRKKEIYGARKRNGLRACGSAAGGRPNPQSSRTPHHTGAAARSVEEQYRGNAEEVSDEIGERVRDFQQRADRYVRENPIKAVFGAAGIGFVLGMISRR